MSKKDKPEGYEFGRPTLYKPEYCQQAIEIMRGGGSRREICLDLSICYQTFLNWLNPSHASYKKDFFEAVKLGDSLCQAWWEKQGRIGTFGGIEGMNATMYQFNMKNRFKEEWRDKQEIQQTTTIVDMTDDDINDELSRLIGDEDDK